MKLTLPKDFLASLKEKLSKKEEQLEEDKKELVEEDVYMQEDRDVGNAEDTDEAIEDLSHLETEEKIKLVDELHEQVEKAQDKMEEGTYGTCDVCGETIKKERLEVYPEATTCMKCSEKTEQA